MIPVLLLGAALIGGAVVLAVFWKDIAAWVSRVWEKLPASVKENLQGAKAFVQKLDATFKNVMNYYSYDQKTQKWTETVVSKEVDQSQIPADILKKFKAKSKIDITDDVQEKLELMSA